MDRQSVSFRERLRSNRFASTLVVLATLSLGILIGTVVSSGVKGKEKAVTSSDATPLQVPSPQQLSNQFSQIARQLEPAVVNISSEITIKSPHGRGGKQAPGDDGSDDQSMQDFFNRFFGGQGGQGGGQIPGGPGGPGGEDMRERATGSGVIVDPKGYIVTNAHVVDKADRIKVKLMYDPATRHLRRHGDRNRQGNRSGSDQD